VQKRDQEGAVVYQNPVMLLVNNGGTAASGSSSLAAIG
jgi:hypothetical protein